MVARLSVRGRTAVVIGAGGLATLNLGVLPGPAFASVGVAVIVGASRGMFSLVEAAPVADLWGAERFARRNRTRTQHRRRPRSRGDSGSLEPLRRRPPPGTARPVSPLTARRPQPDGHSQTATA
ncbi:hypothetical protein Ga0074812_1058 [Parafrankia irregularis]|uniref:Uncharacterized protein n=1 Tax=Parafrankia irregularis TaxID=795642 RepID=A0A0S4QIJ4_9ACTN|nr:MULTISPECIES: hypothetical protein [Parafrankia]MBE3205737.1 hypothetical protein [Parafrankia sp. CH37]CUU55360.1 hypothetical protein Ga0074812_1058 [Parafrankia irregularis]